ncbi:TFIIB-type zinc finger domain-containing protein [Butyrivibrio sp. AC2005]|uniref:TFIIB-type zinc finger domain-containing protein n=1 Tax=Butyrivibrio sp. AC2005 TaxID=1280672 RepID=UPI00041B23ED|nr:TFIIB-type zinc finger domain-containing protein [Butyrivibrio sp. AC2005]
MKKLVCEMCGSGDLVKQEGLYVCQSCGTKYSVEEARKMMVEVCGQVSIDDSGKLDTYLQMADSAFKASNWQEAYNYYCKAQEIDVNNYHSIYRKGISYGWWKGNLMDFHAQEVIGGVVNAKKVMAISSDDPHKKAVEVSNMMSEISTWAGALGGASISGGLQSITSSPTAAQNFYERMCIVSELFIFAFDLLDEQSYACLNVAERNSVKNNAKEITDLTKEIAGVMSSAGTLNVSNGVKFNSFWLMYQDAYKKVNAPSSVSEQSRRLSTATSRVRSQFDVWDNNIAKREAEQKEKEKRERREQFFIEHPEINNEYTAKIGLKNNLEVSKRDAEGQVNSLEKELNSINSKITKIQDEIDASNREIEKLQKKIFGKKKAQEEILRKQAVIESLEKELATLDTPRKESQEKVNMARRVLDDISNKLNTVENDINSIIRDNGLE